MNPLSRKQNPILSMGDSSSGPGTLVQVGQVAPDFELPDSTGVNRRLSELADSRPVVVLFYRGHW
jgi:AhpC/TSA family